MTQNTEEKHTCECTLYRKLTSFRGEHHPCGKPAKRQLTDGKWACGIHLAAERKRLEANAAHNDKLRAAKRYTERLNALSEKLGLELKTYHSSTSHRFVYDQTVVNINDLLRLLGYTEENLNG